ncbi:hypothetical protein FQA39_LY05270 [Lamprigera yunnana]|nr:hypothetical protein FQA39_LY05270 [Lamprigera yunnana]
MFEVIEEKKILRIEDMCGNKVYLCWEFVSEVWSLETVCSYKLSYSSVNNFRHIYDDVIRAVAEMSKYSLLKKDVDVVCKQHWIKAIVLKSAAESLYEILGALEFDADHEATCGMENITRFNNVKSSEINIRLEGKDGYTDEKVIALRQCSKVLWENCINHTENLIKNWYEREKVLDVSVNELIIGVNQEMIVVLTAQVPIKHKHWFGHSK